MTSPTFTTHSERLDARQVEGFSLTQDDTVRLKEALAEADRGEGIDGWELLQDLD